MRMATCEGLSHWKYRQQSSFLQGRKELWFISGLDQVWFRFVAVLTDWPWVRCWCFLSFDRAHLSSLFSVLRSSFILFEATFYNLSNRDWGLIFSFHATFRLYSVLPWHWGEQPWSLRCFSLTGWRGSWSQTSALCITIKKCWCTN